MTRPKYKARSRSLCGCADCVRHAPCGRAQKIEAYLLEAYDRGYHDRECDEDNEAYAEAHADGYD